ncbi:MAG: hypothetical protein R3Y43_05300 [Alphaproteobacteria bacterium]
MVQNQISAISATTKFEDLISNLKKALELSIKTNNRYVVSYIGKIGDEFAQALIEINGSVYLRYIEFLDFRQSSFDSELAKELESKFVSDLSGNLPDVTIYSTSGRYLRSY